MIATGKDIWNTAEFINGGLINPCGALDGIWDAGLS